MNAADIRHDAQGKAMRFVPGGTFMMGSEHYYPEERPLRSTRLDAYWIDEAPVTNRDFTRFIEETGHVTLAEVAPDPRDYPGLQLESAIAGSLVFTKTGVPVPLDQYHLWWQFLAGADWKHPLGPQTDIDALDIWDHPVVHIAYRDAAAYADWAGKRLPTEAEHEFAARGGLQGKEFAWGDELMPDGKPMANYWQGHFPAYNSLDDGWDRTSPVGTYLANGYGLYDMIGNVWEWTQDWWEDRRTVEKKMHPSSCCSISNPRGGSMRRSFDRDQPDIKIGRKVLKGGSHLCALNHCQRFRPAARHPETIDTSTSHIGFRCVIPHAPGE